MTSSAKGDADQHRLAARFVDGPHVSAPDKAEQRLADWLTDLSAGAGGCDRRSDRPVPARQDHSARHRRSLALSVRSDARRRARARSGCSNATRSRILPRLIERTCRDVSAAAGEADVMQSASPHEIGGGAADRAVRHRRRLAGDAGDGGADRSRGRLGAGGAALPAAAGSRARPDDAAQSRIARRTDSGLVVLAMGKMGAGELNYSSDIDLIVFFDSEATTLAPDIEPQTVLRARHAGARADPAAAQRRRLRVPGRSAAAAGSRPRRRWRSRWPRRCIITSGTGGPGSAPP